MNQLIRESSLRASQSQRRDTPARLVFTTQLGSTVSRSGRAEVPANLFLEDLTHRRALLVAGDLALGRVPFRDREPVRSAELLGDGPHPVHEPLEAHTRWHDLAAREIDQLARETAADCPPQVLLEQAVR